MMAALHIACAADENYAPYCAAMLHSLLSHNPQSHATVHFLCTPAFTQAVRQQLAAMIESFQATVRFHEIPDSGIEGLPKMKRIPRLMWFRVLLPDLLPELDRILYLDADTLVVDDLTPLWETDLTGYYLGAVTNVIEDRLDHRSRELGLSGPADYFNSGVLLFNLDLMRQDRCGARIFEYARANADRLLWPDQDGLNVVLAPRRLQLHPRWNCQNTLFYWQKAKDIFGAGVVAEATASPAVLHFEGPAQAKPWHYLNDHPYRAIYLARLRQTGFPVPPIQGRTLKNMLFRYSPKGFWPWLRSQRRRLARRRRSSASVS